MSNWTVTINKEEYEFDMFSEAVRMMKTAIKQHICIVVHPSHWTKEQ